MIAAAVILGLAGQANAGGSVQVRTYQQKDGTIVQAHTRAAPGTRTTAPLVVPFEPRTEARTTAPAAAPSTSPAPAAPTSPPAVAELKPNRTVFPPAVLAKDWKVMAEYQTASIRGGSAAWKQLADDGDVIPVPAALPVAYESTLKGLAYVRPTEGPHAGRLFVAQSQFVR